MDYEVVAGIEVHTQVDSKTKAWCNCEISTLAQENTRVCEVCSAQPGTLPVLNRQVIQEAIKVALATNCEISEFSFLDRKNYFYPDLPKGYQITQLTTPYASEGFIEITTSTGTKKIGIERIQIEEDTGKSSHEGQTSLINLNRCGTPLLEIVGKADLRSVEEVVCYLKKLHSILTYLEVTKGNMQEGNFRADVNISLREKGAKEYGTRTEIKNLNSFKSAERAMELEIKRQKAILASGEKIEQQTLNFDFETSQLKVMRTKSDAQDYRYFPEPDLLPVHIDEESIKKVKETLPELPDVKQERFKKEFGIKDYDAIVLTADKKLANYYEEACGAYKGDGKKMANWIMVELLAMINEYGATIEKSKVSPEALAELLTYIDDGKISGKMGKEVLKDMYDLQKSAQDVIKDKGLEQISDESAIETIIKSVLDNNPKELERYKNGEKKLMGFFVGQIMKESKGQANPQVVNKALKEELDK